jgi:hypothetical protein
LAWVYFRQGKYKEAEELYVQSLKVRQTALGDSHPDVARYIKPHRHAFYFFPPLTHPSFLSYSFKNK